MTDLIKRDDALAAIYKLKRWPTDHSGLVSLGEVSDVIRTAPKVECLVDPRLADSIREYVK